MRCPLVAFRKRPGDSIYAGQCIRSSCRSVANKAVAPSPTVFDCRPFRGCLQKFPCRSPRAVKRNYLVRCSRSRIDGTPTPWCWRRNALDGLTLAAAGFLAFSRSDQRVQVVRGWAASKVALPIVAWMMPPLSLRNFTWPALAFLTAVATSAVTEPSFGFGIRPRGPSS